MSTPYRYTDGIEPIIIAGKFRVRGNRVLLRAILATDGSEMARGVAYKTIDAECHEVIAVGPDVPDIKVGQHVYCRSAAADRIRNDETSRFWLIDERDIGAVWDPASLTET